MQEQSHAIRVLVVNCGSSSIKYQLYDMPEKNVLSRGLVDRIGEPDATLQYESAGKLRRRDAQVADHEEGMALILETLIGAEGVLADVAEIGAVGHRVVHGGEEFTGSEIITPKVLESIERFAGLAPLHNPPNLTGIRAALGKMPDVTQVACFDTAFHATIPEVAYTYALPYAWYEKHGVRRYGFHGTSHRFVARRAAELLGKEKYEINCITAHLGNGCSITAVRNGRSVDTSMGLTPLEGLVMGTRSGDFDPAILFYLADHGYKIDDLKQICNRESGLLGLSGESNDMRMLIEKARAGHRRAQLAIDVFGYRVKKYIGMYCAVLGEVDAIVFTGGIGENAAAVRAAACAELTPLGITLDESLNVQAAGRREDRISIPESPVQVLVIPTDEEAAIAVDTYELSLPHIGAGSV